jgi:hypothetical protein
MLWAAFLFSAPGAFPANKEIAPMTIPFEPKVTKRFGAAGDFIGFVPYQIKPDQDEKFGPLLAGFPRNIMLPRVHRSKSGEVLGVAASVYEPDVVTFVEMEERRELTYLNKAGGPYTLKVVLKADGSIAALKCKGTKVVAAAAGKEFDRAMFQVGLMGIAPDERVSFVKKCA